MATAPPPSRQAEALIGLVPLSNSIGGGPDHRPLSVREAPLIQVPEERGKTLLMVKNIQLQKIKSRCFNSADRYKINERNLNTTTKAKWFQQLIPLPLLSKGVPFLHVLLHGEAAVGNNLLCYGTGLFDQAQTPGGDWPPLDGVWGEKSRSNRSQVADGVMMGHPARLHGNMHKRRQLFRLWVPKV